MTNNVSIADIRPANHQLLRTDDATPRQIVAHFGMMQAQDFNSAMWAIGVRLNGCTEKMVREDFNKGEILRTHVLRPTWHLVSPENIRWMLKLSARRIIQSMKSRDRELGLTDEIYAKCYRIMENALDKEDNVTRDGLMNVLHNAGIVNSSQMYHVMAGAEANGIICSGVLCDNKPTYALLEKRVPAAKPLTKEESLAKLAQIYFTGHGPATLQDFVWWSGLPVGEARQGLESVQSEFVTETIDGQKYWMPDIDFMTTAGSALFLLPAFDEYIVGYKDRTAVITSENHKKAISSNGIFRPVVIKNGRVIGLWKKAISRKKNITVTPFEPIDPATQQQIDIAAERFQMFSQNV
jgi:hypothetical protein